MADKKYISKIVKGSDTLYIKDEEAREILEGLSSAMHWLGVTTTALTDGATTNPIVIGGENVTAKAGDVAVVAGSGSGAQADKEFVFNGTKWQEYGSTGSLGALAFKSNASGSYTPQGSNAASAVSFSGQADGDFVTGYDDDGVADQFSAGSLPTLGESTKSAFVTGYSNDGVADQFSAGTFPTLGSPTTGSFATEGEVSSYNESTETLTFSAASESDALTAQGTLSAGTLPSFTAGSLPTLTTANAVTECGTFSQGSLPSFTAGSLPSLVTGKAITAVGTGTAAAQTFTGTAATITVS